MRLWLKHIVLGLTCLTILVSRFATVETLEERWEILRDESRPEAERIEAAFVITQRADSYETVRMGDGFTRLLLESDSELLREFAMTSAVIKHHPGFVSAQPPALQSEYLTSRINGGEWSPHLLRCLLLQRRLAGGAPFGASGRLRWTEIHWFLATLHGDPVPTAEEVLNYIASRLTGRKRD